MTIVDAARHVIESQKRVRQELDRAEERANSSADLMVALVALDAAIRLLERSLEQRAEPAMKGSLNLECKTEEDFSRLWTAAFEALPRATALAQAGAALPEVVQVLTEGLGAALVLLGGLTGPASS